MRLPLPKKIKRLEAEVQRRVAEAVRKRNLNKNWLLEIKIKGNPLLPHQKVAQKQVENGIFLHKLKDMGAAVPGDYIGLGDADAVVCVVDPIKKNNRYSVACKVNGGVSSYSFSI